MEQRFQFMVASKAPPKVELTDAGLYIRFQVGAEVDQTIIQNEWPHIAVDLDAKRQVIGIELVPAPQAFSIGQISAIASKAGVGGIPRFNPGDVQIENLCAA